MKDMSQLQSINPSSQNDLTWFYLTKGVYAVLVLPYPNPMSWQDRLLGQLLDLWNYTFISPMRSKLIAEQTTQDLDQILTLQYLVNCQQD